MEKPVKPASAQTQSCSGFDKNAKSRKVKKILSIIKIANSRTYKYFLDYQHLLEKSKQSMASKLFF